MSMSKDALEGMASILRENGYEVALKESETEESDIKKPYINNKFNKIRNLDLESIEYDTCIFLKGNVVGYFKMHDYVAGSDGVTIGYIARSYDEDEDEDYFDEVNSLKTNRADVVGNTIVEKLSDYDYVIKLADVFKLMDSNGEFNA